MCAPPPSCTRADRAFAARLCSGKARGFTLIELMIVVVIVGILGTLAVYGTRRYIASSKTGEAIQLIGSIKAGEEAYKDETFSYLDVTGSLKTFYPANSTPGQAKVMWGGGNADMLAKWNSLGVQPTAPVLFVYACRAGGPDDTVESPTDGGDITIGSWPTAAPGTAWYVVKAKADLDSGGRLSTYVAPSFTNQIFSANEGE
ncbi:MAG TPA: type II secretion system protein [Polyangiaceae bacterium]|nr:type II secretion system protein [Polyangiaceae bacterium]